jgi:hypothetical protein
MPEALVVAVKVGDGGPDCARTLLDKVNDLNDGGLGMWGKHGFLQPPVKYIQRRKQR